MTLEEFKEKYEFANNMNNKDINRLVQFIMIMILEISMGNKNYDRKISEFIKDVIALNEN